MKPCLSSVLPLRNGSIRTSALLHSFRATLIPSGLFRFSATDRLPRPSRSMSGPDVCGQIIRVYSWCSLPQKQTILTHIMFDFHWDVNNAWNSISVWWRMHHRLDLYGATAGTSSWKSVGPSSLTVQGSRCQAHLAVHSPFQDGWYMHTWRNLRKVNSGNSPCMLGWCVLTHHRIKGIRKRDVELRSC